ncbi:MAG: NAD(P)H-dependent oxidoreductase [Mesorhizobium sp.]|nr:MAG: NAD(P)H-dependent oxidoreductase [Mesorhizobium sp.]
MPVWSHSTTSPPGCSRQPGNDSEGKGQHVAHSYRPCPPEPHSFNGALTRTAQEALSAAGHEVVVSDLYATGFNPVSGRHNFRLIFEESSVTY